ncbi:MAG TPA: septal ring lytic transglycosylase RlpA family protein [Anaeromyxobacter sp.]
MSRPASAAAPRPGRVALAALALAAGCAHAPRPHQPPPAEREAEERGPGERGPPAAVVGVASFYGRKFHGRRTASGARYDMHAFTCAHRTAPFGTRLRVTDLETGRSVVVTVTDRGPFVRGRVVDVSLAAARALGMVERGVARVRLERVRD